MSNREYYTRVKTEVLSFYSNGTLQCRNCGFRDIRALQLDHILDDGAQERKRVPAGFNFYCDLRRRGYPPGLQVLCANCNWIKEHERSRMVKR